MSLPEISRDGFNAPPEAHAAGPDFPAAATQRLYPSIVKPALDRLFGGILLILLSPIMLVVAVLIRIELGSPIIYRQKRVGLAGGIFDFYKFRTMIPDRRRQSRPISGPDRRVVHKSPDDPRVTQLGKKLRAWRLDELPQFWNVVKGDMSLVGPRPEMPEIVASYAEWQHQRHQVRPGVTGPWQISEHNGHLMHECTEIDLDYIGDIRFIRDMGILLRTPFAMFGRRGGY